MITVCQYVIYCVLDVNLFLCFLHQIASLSEDSPNSSVHETAIKFLTVRRETFRLLGLSELDEFSQAGQPQVHRSDLAPQML